MDINKEIARRKKEGWSIPSYNTNHLTERIRAAGAILSDEEWLFPDQQSYEAMRHYIAVTASQHETKLCVSCGEDKPLHEFRLDDDSPDGRSRRCDACSSRPPPREEDSPNNQERIRGRRFSGSATHEFPPINTRLYDEYSIHPSFPGSMMLANALLWWEQIDVPAGARLARHNYFPRALMQTMVADTEITWGTHVRMMKKILNNVYLKHVQNQRGVGYRISTDLAHDGLEATKLYELVRTFSFSIHRRLNEAWTLFPEAPEETQEVMRQVFMMSESQANNLSDWSRIFYRAFFYLRQQVVAGSESLRPPDDIGVGEMQADVEAVFHRAVSWIGRLGDSLGYNVSANRKEEK